MASRRGTGTIVSSAPRSAVQSRRIPPHCASGKPTGACSAPDTAVKRPVPLRCTAGIRNNGFPQPISTKMTRRPSTKPSPTPTIRDVARVAKVSVATVSRALASPDTVRAATREMVENAIRKTGYRPNALASRLRRQKSDSIVVVVPSIHNPFFSNVIRGIENLAHLSGYKVLLGESQGNQERLDSYASMLARKEADGLILLGALLPSILKEAGGILLESTPRGLKLDDVRRHILQVPHVIGVHDLHASTIATGLPVLTAHVVVDESCFTQGHVSQKLRDLQTCVAEHFDVSVEHSTFQIEAPSHSALERHSHH